MKHAHIWVALAPLIIAACAPPNVDGLEADVVKLDQTLAEIDTELADYPGGLINGLLMTRKQLTSATKEMLAQKRASLLYWIDLKYAVDGPVAQPATAEKLGRIMADLKEVQAEVEVAEIEAKYSGGLIGAVKQAEVATRKLTVATIRHRYSAAKYGIPVILFAPGEDEGDVDKKPRFEIDPSEL